MSLQNITFKNIINIFYSGKSGKFTLIIKSDDDFFNASKLCRLGKKEYNEWFKLENTQLLMREMSKKYGFYFFKSLLDIPNDTPKRNIIAGEYLRMELILDLARWISLECYMECSVIIINYFENKLNETIKQKDKTIKELQDTITNTTTTTEIENLQCIICVSNKKNMISDACKHVTCCGPCSEKLNLKCPMCRMDTAFSRIYI